MYTYTHITAASLFDLSKTAAAGLFEGITYPWEVLPLLKEYIYKLGASLSAEEYDNPSPGVWIARDATVAPTAFIGEGVIICAGAQIRHCAFIRGSAIVGAGAVVGNSCELKNCLLFDGVQVPHFNYVGDSVLGYKAHLGAGAVTSNVKIDRGQVVVHCGDGIETGLRKFGAIIGDRSEVGCNSVLNPGTVIGRNTNVYPLSSVRGIIPADSIYKTGGEIVAKR